MENLFSYGTLQKEPVQLKLFGRLLGGVKDTLEGYRIATIEIKDEAFLAKGEEKFQWTLVLSPDDSDVVFGTVFEISEAELVEADKYEPEGYKRSKFLLRSGKEAWVYAFVNNL